MQRRELDDARNQDDCTIREWFDAPGVEYVAVDGELELLPGLRLLRVRALEPELVWLTHQHDPWHAT